MTNKNSYLVIRNNGHTYSARLTVLRLITEFKNM